MPQPSLLGFLQDKDSQRAVGRGLLDAANRGWIAQTFGAPVDMATQAVNLGIAGAGYLGHKAGLFKQPPELLDAASVPGSSEWIGQKMQNAGMVSPERNPIAEAGMGLLSPVAFKGAQKVGGLLANAEMRAAENLSQPPAMEMRGQRGAVRFWHGSPSEFDRFDSSKAGSGAGKSLYGKGIYLADSEATAKPYATMNGPGHLYEVSVPDEFAANLVNAELPLSRQPSGLLAKLAIEPSMASQLKARRAQLLSSDGAITEAAQKEASLIKASLDLSSEVQRARRLGRDPSLLDVLMSVYGSEDVLSAAGVPGYRYLERNPSLGGGTSGAALVFPGGEANLKIASRAPVAK